MTTNDIDARTIAADIMTGNARSITYTEIWAHIGQAYDTAEIDAMVVEEVADLIAKAGIDLIWPDGMKDTELGAARVEIERLRIEVSERTAERDAALDKARDDYADDNTRVAVALVDVQRKLAATEAERDAARDMANEVRELLTGAVHALDKARAENDKLAEVADELAAANAALQTAERAALAAAVEVEQIANVRALCDQYKDQPPPIFEGPGLSERGEGYNAGTRDMARAVLGVLSEAEVALPKPEAEADDQPCCGYRCQDNTTGVTR